MFVFDDQAQDKSYHIIKLLFLFAWLSFSLMLTRSRHFAALLAHSLVFLLFSPA